MEGAPRPGRPLSANTHPKNVMVLGAIGSDEQISLTIFVDTDGKISRLVFDGILARHAIPWVEVTCSEGNFAFQQDVSPDHNIAVVQDG